MHKTSELKIAKHSQTIIRNEKSENLFTVPQLSILVTKWHYMRASETEYKDGFGNKRFGEIVFNAKFKIPQTDIVIERRFRLDLTTKNGMEKVFKPFLDQGVRNISNLHFDQETFKHIKGKMIIDIAIPAFNVLYDSNKKGYRTVEKSFMKVSTDSELKITPEAIQYRSSKTEYVDVLGESEKKKKVVEEPKEEETTFDLSDEKTTEEITNDLDDAFSEPEEDSDENDFDFKDLEF